MRPLLFAVLFPVQTLMVSIWRREPIRAHLVQIAILSNHMNGKDTHVRGVRIFAPRV